MYVFTKTSAATTLVRKINFNNSSDIFKRNPDFRINDFYSLLSPKMFRPRILFSRIGIKDRIKTKKLTLDLNNARRTLIRVSIRIIKCTYFLIYISIMGFFFLSFLKTKTLLFNLTFFAIRVLFELRAILLLCRQCYVRINFM